MGNTSDSPTDSSSDDRGLQRANLMNLCYNEATFSYKANTRNVSGKSSARRLALFLSCALLYVIHLANPTFFPELWQVLKSGDLLATADYIRSFGSWAMFFSFWLVLFVNAIGFPPAIIFSTANTLIFGIVPGIVLSVIAETIGVTISFLLRSS